VYSHDVSEVLDLIKTMDGNCDLSHDALLAAKLSYTDKQPVPQVKDDKVSSEARFTQTTLVLLPINDIEDRVGLIANRFRSGYELYSSQGEDEKSLDLLIEKAKADKLLTQETLYWGRFSIQKHLYKIYTCKAIFDIDSTYLTKKTIVESESLLSESSKSVLMHVFKSAGKNTSPSVTSFTRLMSDFGYVLTIERTREGIIISLRESDKPAAFVDGIGPNAETAYTAMIHKPGFIKLGASKQVRAWIIEKMHDYKTSDRLIPDSVTITTESIKDYEVYFVVKYSHSEIVYKMLGAFATRRVLLSSFLSTLQNPAVLKVCWTDEGLSQYEPRNILCMRTLCYLMRLPKVTDTNSNVMIEELNASYVTLRTKALQTSLIGK